MPYNIRIIPGREFIKLDAEGHLDLEMSRKVLSDVIWTCLRSRMARVLIDVREATSDMTAAHLCKLADVCREISAQDQDDDRIAILSRPKDEFDRAAFLAAKAESAGWNVAAFQEFEKAFDWLMS